jgi:hypothetical protein
LLLTVLFGGGCISTYPLYNKDFTVRTK